MAVGEHNPAYDSALVHSEIIRHAAEKLSQTTCAVFNIRPTNAGDAFWLQIAIGISPYNVNQLVWKRREGDIESTYYAHLFRLRIPFEIGHSENGADKLRQIGSSLADIWDESRHSPILRGDRRYIIPHLDQHIWGTETIPDDATQPADRSNYVPPKFSDPNLY